jgi:hypothetical protein
MQFESYPAERLIIASLVSRLTPAERVCRQRLLDYAIRRQQPFNLNEPVPPELQGLVSKETVAALISKKVVAAAANGAINFMYPVSVVPTAHQVQVADGRRFFAMCAVDALGTTFTLGQEVQVQSKCSECGRPVTVTVRQGQIAGVDPPGTRVLHVDLNKFDNWAGSTWNIMNFFCMKKHYDSWTKSRNVNPEEVFCLNVYEALEVARMLFGE